MSLVGFQDHWVTGSRLYFKRDAVGGVAQPWQDMGVVDVVSPQVNPTVQSLKDNDGGTLTTVEKNISEIAEVYDVTHRNLAPDALALAFYSDPPTDLGRAATDFLGIDHVIAAGDLGRLIHVVDGSGKEVFGFDAIYGLTTGGATTTGTDEVTAIDAGARTFATATDLSAQAGLAVNESFMMTLAGATPLADKSNARTYTITAHVPNQITVREAPSSSETGRQGTIIYGDAAGTVYGQGSSLTAPVDGWDVYSKDRGFLRLLPGGTVTAGTRKLFYRTSALSGLRQLRPQQVAGEIQGEAVIVFGRVGNTRQTVRHCRVAVTPNQNSFSDTEFSGVGVTYEVITDLTDTVNPTGILTLITGAVPATS